MRAKKFTQMFGRREVMNSFVDPLSAKYFCAWKLCERTNRERVQQENHGGKNQRQEVKWDKGCAVRFVDYIARFSTYIVNRSTINGEISQDNPQISSPQT